MTKSKTKIEYIRRINKAFDFIDKHLDQSIQLDDVAKASHFSSYHFHRIFHAMVGETVNDYISRKRMEKSIRFLVSKPELSVTDIAAMGGFSSGANFSKAFKLYFGVSPSELRQIKFKNTDECNQSKIGKLYSKYGKTFNPQDLYPKFVTRSEVVASDKLEERLMDVKVEDKQEKLIACLSSPGGYEMDSIFSTWDKLINWAENHNIGCDSQIRFGICHDNPVITPENKCRYDAAIEIGSDVDVASPFNTSTIPSGKYAIAYYKDDADKISDFMTELCGSWFQDSGYEPDNYPAVFNYLNDSRKDGYVEMNVYIKLKALALG